MLKKNSLWLLLFYMAVATYCYYEKVRRTMRTAVVSYLLKQKYPRSTQNQFAARRNIESLIRRIKNINMEFLTGHHLFRTTLSIPRTNNTDKQITDPTKFKVVTKSKVLSLENEVSFFWFSYFNVHILHAKEVWWKYLRGLLRTRSFNFKQLLVM